MRATEQGGRRMGGFPGSLTRHRISFLLMRFHHGFFHFLDALVKENVILPADRNQKKNFSLILRSVK